MNWARAALLVAVGFALLAACAAAAPAQTAPRRPNIVFILADDLGWRDLSNEGSTFYESPHIDSIAAGGMKFTRGYAACRVCSPSRASILTGKTPPKHGITTWIGDAAGEQWCTNGRHDSHMPPEYARALRAEEHTLAEALRDAGYRTFFAGKWHLGGRGSWPGDHGFERNVGGWDSGSPRGGYFSPYTNPNLESGPAGESLPLRLARETATFIEEHREEPFLAFLSFYSVHGPIQTTRELWRKYRDKAVEAGPAEHRFAFDRRLAVRQVQDCPIYAGMIEAMDDAVGIVLAKLEELGLTEDTIVCFTSDNGGVASGDAFSTSNLPLRGGKGRQWEGGLREPFYLRAPGRTRPGTTSSTPVSGIDWYPTLLELAGADVPAAQEVDGTSLVPLLAGGALAPRPLFWHYPHYGNQGAAPSGAVRSGDWKLVEWFEDGTTELFDLGADPGESRNLAPEQPGRTAALQASLKRWRQGVQAKMPRPNPNFGK